jgi:hypothetical protein
MSVQLTKLPEEAKKEVPGRLQHDLSSTNRQERSMFKKLISVYREFALDGRRADEVVKELMDLSGDLGIMDGKLELAIMKAFRTEKMLDVEIAKELFHVRLKVIGRDRLGGVDPETLFANIGCRPHGKVRGADMIE